MTDLTGQESPFANDPIVIAVRDDTWGSIHGDAYDSDPVYYEHHDGVADHDSDPEDVTDGFVQRGNHYVILFVTKLGGVGIDTGYHEDEIPAHAFVMR